MPTAIHTMVTYQAIGWNLNWYKARNIFNENPARGIIGYSGTRYLRGISGCLRRSTMTDRFTIANVNRKIKLAADPTASIGRVNAITNNMTPVITIATCGVRRLT